MLPQDVGARIASRRKELDLTLQDIADRVHVARSTIQRYESATISRMKMPVLLSIAQALDVNPDWLIGKTDNQTHFTTRVPPPAAEIYTPAERALVRAYRIASPADRQIIDNIVERYSPSGETQMLG